MLLRMIRENPYGWLVVAVLFTVLTLVMSARSALGLLIPEWEAEFAWDRTFISTGGSVMLTVMAIGSPIAGMALDRYGARTIFAVAILVTADRGLPDRGHVGGLAFHRRVRADRRDRLLDRFPPR